MSFSYGPVHSWQTSSWWEQQSEPAGSSAWQQPNDWHWMNQYATQWTKPETSIQVWNEQTSPWVRPGPARDNTPQQWTITTHAIPQCFVQQACARPAWALPTQFKSNEQPSSEHAYRIEQLEIALKEQQEQRHKEEATQLEVNQMQFVLQQMEDWRAWKESEDSSCQK